MSTGIMGEILPLTSEHPQARRLMAESRRLISQRMARLLALFLPVLLFPTIRTAFLAEQWPVLFSFLLGLVLIAYAALAVRLPHQLRSTTLILALELLIVGEVAAHGLIVDALPYALLALILATTLLDVWVGIGIFLVNLAGTIGAASLTQNGLVDTSSPLLLEYLAGNLWLWVTIKFAILLPLMVMPFLWLLDDTGHSLGQQRDLSRALRQEQQLLTRRIATRRQALETSLQISANLATLLNVDLLVDEVVQQIHRSFNYYHVQIYLLRKTKPELELRGATGIAGKELLARDHAVGLGEGMVGRAARERELLLASDVRQDPHWLPNELLPDTRAEIAIPIVAGEDLIGVLDVQHDLLEGLTADELVVLQTIANQVAIAVQNASLFQRAQRRAETVAMVNRVVTTIRHESDLDQVLKMTVKQMGELVSAREAQIVLSLDKED